MKKIISFTENQNLWKISTAIIIIFVRISNIKFGLRMSLVMCNIATSGNDNNNNNEADKNSVTIYRWNNCCNMN